MDSINKGGRVTWVSLRKAEYEKELKNMKITYKTELTQVNIKRGCKKMENIQD